MQQELQNSTLNGEEMIEDTQTGRYLAFSLGAEAFGVEIRYVTEIIGLQVITPLPEVPEYIKGIINLRGKVIPVIDMRLKFGKPSVEYNDRTCIIVLDHQEMTVGLIVDTVAEVIAIDEENIVPPPEGADIQNTYLSGIGMVGEEVKLLLDCDRVLNDEVALDMREN
ncbi:chemotaxis protein CheW [Eubacteriales bacterium OttesenSCG-928-M02]|nr:chemotaxis protein CheW [Eubacteriales bacterium OttesenSCG-928-M02]